jgi:hypothetical protein
MFLTIRLRTRAKSEYQLGLDRGLFDIKSETPFIVVAKILDKHPQAFWNGWLEGLCMNGYGSSEADELTFDCSTYTPSSITERVDINTKA